MTPLLPSPAKKKNPKTKNKKNKNKNKKKPYTGRDRHTDSYSTGMTIAHQVRSKEGAASYAQQL